MSARETELAAFQLVNRELENAADVSQRIRAFGRNHDLWSALVKDLALSNNALPDELRAQLIQLGLWSMQYSICATLKDLPALPLLNVNRNIVEGLLAQQTAALSALQGAVAV